ncbi:MULTISPECIES: endonuclease/exonuclease/phosphatase family protein [unclassified Streptococcus]|uniref:endonuclease/exonuclease/phosphatase family protein n=1 Tax=unclassified Streptococcus TaxID=2608887 RepID=UPI0010721F3B|nr:MULTISPECIES: endonuclease/exonuclease/phosphatase family protein [unclassified Streptococcus]MBF0787400.1 endonuclease/exonuclease/phosphatase family protein [Streptococcus sp. 19428wC2_LYSM12]MCQ9211775.1 endonuclease/exonuclease/phosphatase family protein [Streptococcus sp. B01]MCQ9213036.1 endonuclease/exonuclease/phosphatase family protein [Streptococcus sp. O1]TFV05621.1 endonuclease/exonuclease/phosphatase family protein [Streptococcus sp. LYSM12]
MITVATYNIKNACPVAVAEHNWVHRKESMMQLIRSRNWDIVGLQEVTEEQWQDFADLEEFERLGTVRDTEEYGEYNPILFRKVKYRCLESHTFWLSPTPQMMSKADCWNAACFRIATWALLEDKQSGKEILVINTHFDHVSPLAREESAKQVLDFVKSQSYQEIILMGDLNATPAEACYPILCQHFRDVSVVAEHCWGPEGSFIDEDFPEDIEGKQLEKIDYIFVSGQFAIPNTEIVAEKRGPFYPSDHLPLECHLIQL